ncbi:sensor histidine kinase [Marinoscillum pacificum]|uniref:sensor histidine kinase n=1 Tax=Marinoscillum pacificum TaxID=392723 RepID=UPI00215818DA|nr:ATP-binding protein [Marinoscillum pacificum]
MSEYNDNRSLEEEIDLGKEKLLLMGRLLAGIAHEINTPLGALNASIQSLSESYLSCMEALPQSLDVKDQDLAVILFDLIREASAFNKTLSTREIRAKRKEMTLQLAKYNEMYAASWADQFVDVGFTEGIDAFGQLFSHPKSPELIHTALSIIKQAKTIDNIILAVDKIKNITGAIKSFSRNDKEDEKQTIDLRDNIETVLILYKSKLKQGIITEKDYTSQPVFFKCNASEIMQVWTNLIHNGIHAMNGVGTLSIAVNTTQEHIIVSIQDSGTGIPDDIQQKIFEPYFTTKPQGEGTGLGLDIVKNIVEKYSGSITFETSSEGTKFIIQFPNHQQV